MTYCVQGLHRTAHHFHAQRVALFPAQQPSSFPDSHPVSSSAVAVSRLVHVGHAFGDVDEVLPFHRCLTVETFIQFGVLAVVGGNLTDGDVHQFARVFCPYHQFVQLDGGRLQFDLQRSRVVYLDFFSLISQVRNNDGLGLSVCLQSEIAIVVGHHRYAFAFRCHTGLREFASGALVGHRAAHHHFLCHRQKKGK